VVRRRLRSLGLEYSIQALRRLTDILAEETGVPVSHETVRWELTQIDLVFSQPQHTISSPDPEYQIKKSRKPETDEAQAMCCALQMNSTSVCAQPCGPCGVQKDKRL
jgi:hypothetical protein